MYKLMKRIHYHCKINLSVLITDLLVSSPVEQTLTGIEFCTTQTYQNALS